MNNLDGKIRKSQSFDTITVRYCGNQAWSNLRDQFVINKKPYDIVWISVGGKRYNFLFIFKSDCVPVFNFNSNFISVKNNKNRIPAHRDFLTSVSTFFESLFHRDKEQFEIQMENIGAKSLKPIIKYYYGGSFPITNYILFIYLTWSILPF